MGEKSAIYVVEPNLDAGGWLRILKRLSLQARMIRTTDKSDRMLTHGQLRTSPRKQVQGYP